MTPLRPGATTKAQETSWSASGSRSRWGTSSTYNNRHNVYTHTIIDTIIHHIHHILHIHTYTHISYLIRSRWGTSSICSPTIYLSFNAILLLYYCLLIKVGDFIRIKTREMVPADVVILSVAEKTAPPMGMLCVCVF
jgi:hypothetical protein